MTRIREVNGSSENAICRLRVAARPIANAADQCEDSESFSFLRRSSPARSINDDRMESSI